MAQILEVEVVEFVPQEQLPHLEWGFELYYLEQHCLVEDSKLLLKQ